MCVLERPKMLELKFNGELISSLLATRKELSAKIKSMSEEDYDRNIASALELLVEKITDYKDLQYYLMTLGREEEYERYGEFAIDLKLVNFGYQIIMNRETSYHKGVAIGYNQFEKSKFVTWEYDDRYVYGEREIKFYWGHYFDTFEEAVADYRDR